MATVSYNIVSGAADFSVELTPSSIPKKIHTSVGTYQFDNVPNGDYMLVVTDANDCVYQKSIYVNPNGLTTTAAAQDISIIVGNTNDELLIFENETTKRPDHYVGYPLENEMYQYLWFKSENGLPLIASKLINYRFELPLDSRNTVTIVEISDEVNSEIYEAISGPNLIITGQMYLKSGFIETFVKYKIDNNSSVSNYSVILNSRSNDFSENITIVDDVNIYGVTYVDKKNIIMNF